MKKIARVFIDVRGYHVCDDGSAYLDTRGRPHQTKASALRKAWALGFTHATGSGTTWTGIRAIPKAYRVDAGGRG